MTSDEVIISLQDVHKRFGDRVILDGVNIDVHNGETVALMGPSGTGKSVTLRHIIGLIKPDSGRVLVEGHDMAHIKPAELRSMRQRMGYLFQEGALINWLSAGDNVALPLRENNPQKLSDDEIRRRCLEKLDLVHLPGVWDKMPSELSGGMRKRVGLARALVTEPSIILYDEPNAGLDPEISMSINQLIRELSDRLSITSLVVTHLVRCVRIVADRVILLDAGKVVADMPPEPFLSSDLPRLRRFLGQDPD